MTKIPRLNDAQRLANDRHRHWVPVLVIAFLVLVAYLWTHWMVAYPPPGIDALADHSILGKAFTGDPHLKSVSWMHHASEPGNHDQQLMLLLLSGIGFLLAYYLPLGLKRQPLVFLTCIGVAWALGLSAMALFVGWHVLAYVTFHAPHSNERRTIVILGVLASCGWLPYTDILSGDFVLGAGLTMPLLYFGYRYLFFPLLMGRARGWLQLCVAHGSLIYIGIALLWNSLQSESLFPNPVGWLLFFWQWERVVMYYVDLKDGRIPDDVTLLGYLTIFMSPATLSNFHWLSRIPLGYDYLTRSFYARDKNLVVLSGVWLITLSVAYFSLRPVILELFELGVSALGIEPMTRYSQLVKALRQGVDLHPGSVWCALIYAFLKFYFLWAAVAHLKVGLWRLFGYDIEPYFQKPFLSTNLVELWKRYSYYYKEFLVRAFYYPVFLRFFKKQPRLRVFVATLAAAGFGNLIYHLMYGALRYGAEPEVIAERLNTIPYYIILGTAIALTQLWLLARGRRRRRPWQWGWKIGLDVLAVIGTIGFFVLIRPFHHVPKDYANIDCVRIILAAFGIQI